MLLTQSLVYFVEDALGMTFTLSGEVFERTGELARHGGTVAVTPAGFASFVLPLLLIAIARLLTPGDASSITQLGLVAAGLLALILTLTRAAWSGFGLGLMVLLFLGARRGLVKPRRIAAFLGVCFLVLAAATPKIMARLENSVPDAYEERRALMQMAMNVIAAHPLQGVGAGAYPFVFGRYLTPDLERSWLYIVHNQYLLRWAETGFLGFAAFVTLLVLAARDAYRLSESSDPELAAFGIAWAAGLVALAWEMYWDIWQGFPYNALLWALCGFVVAVRRIDRAAESAKRPIMTTHVQAA
jgi:O-antigen ligase